MSRVTRVLIVAAVILVVALAALYLSGGRSRHYTSQVVMAVPKNVVFQFLTDPDLIQQWSGGESHYRPLSEPGQPDGSRARIAIDFAGNRWQFDSEVVESKPDERLITDLHGSRFDARSDFWLEQTNGSTTLNHTLIVTPRGWMRFIAPFSGDQFQLGLNQGLDQFKQYVERAVQQQRLPLE